MSAGQARHAQHVNVVLHRHARRLARSLEQRSDIHIEPHIGERRGDHLGAAIMAVLPHLCHQNARPPPFQRGKLLGQLASFAEVRIVLTLGRIHARDGPIHRLIPPKNFLERRRNLTQGCPRPCRRHCQSEQIAGTLFRRRRERRQRVFDRLSIARRPHLRQPAELRLAYRFIIHYPNVDLLHLRQPVLIYPDDDLFARIDLRLPPRRRFLDAHLGNARLDGLCHSAEPFHFLNVLPRLVHQLVREALHVVASGPRVHHLGDARFFLQENLRITRDARREIRRQRDGLIERIGVQRLRVTQHRR